MRNYLEFLKIIEDHLAGLDSWSLAQSKKAERHQIDPDNAARKIQSIWRTRQFHKNFNANSYKKMIDMHSDPIDRTLSQYMFGKTNAIYKKERELSFLPRNPYVQQEVTSEIGYYRTDPLAALENIDDIIKIYDNDFSPKKFDYIPITLSQVLSLDNIIETYAHEFKDKIKVIHHPTDSNNLLAFIKINKSDSQFFQLKKILITLGLYSGSFISKVAGLGIKSSQWQLAVQREIHDQQNIGQTATLPQYSLPTTVRELKESAMVKSLKENKKHSSTQHLATTLIQLIDNIDDNAPVDPEAIKRLALFVDLVTHLYKQNYTRFAFILYCVIHELTLLFHKKQISIEYRKFLKAAQINTAKTFDLSETSPTIRYVAFPANSGTNALMLALDIAKKSSGGNVSIRLEGPIYFEFDRLKLAQATQDNSAHDIYLLTAGPTVWQGIYPGLDLNRIIRERIKQGINKPMTLIVDATSGMHRHLQIAEDLKKHILDGKVSILVNESHQKFGLAHSDQAQYGYVFGVCSTKHYNESKLNECEAAAEKDLQTNIDMQIGSYLTLCAEEPLEKIKERHFKNGVLMRDLLSKMGLTESKMLPDPNSIDDPERGLFIYVLSLSCLGRAIQKHFECRDSFGHFNSTWCECGPFTRLTVSASDQIDVFIEAAEIYFASFYSEKKMLAELSRVSKEQISTKEQGNLPHAEQIGLMGLIQTLSHLKYTPKTLIDQLEWSLAIKCMRERCPALVGRKSYQAILEQQEGQFLKENSTTYNPISAVIYRVSKMSFPLSSAPTLLALLNEYTEAGKSKKKRNNLVGLQAAIILCGHPYLKEDCCAIKNRLIANTALSQAIIDLDRFDALSSSVYAKLKSESIQPLSYHAITCLAQLAPHSDHLNVNKGTTFKSTVELVLRDESLAKAIIMLSDCHQLIVVINQRLMGFKATPEERKILLGLKEDLKKLLPVLEKTVYSGKLPLSIDGEQYSAIQTNLQQYIRFGQQSPSASHYLKIILIFLKNIIEQIRNFSISPGPSKSKVTGLSQNIIANFTFLGHKNQAPADDLSSSIAPIDPSG